MRRLGSLLVVIGCLSGGVFAFADDSAAPDCVNMPTQADMNSCAAIDADKADKALNAQYKKTRAAAVEFDKGMDGSGASAVEKLTAAQRAWITFRDATCDIQTAISGGGSMEATLVYGCLESETKKRTEDLKSLQQDFGN